LQADCLAGAFTHVAYYQGILDADDITEGAQARFDVGDDLTDPAQHHGTPEERRDAFLTGYNGENPDVCVAYNPFS
jgi:predicted metalloprotease